MEAIPILRPSPQATLHGTGPFESIAAVSGGRVEASGTVSLLLHPAGDNSSTATLMYAMRGSCRNPTAHDGLANSCLQHTSVPPAVEHSKGGEHDVTNGLSLRTDLHRLFDTGYITVDEQYRLVVGDRLKRDHENGRSYYAMKGQKLVLPNAAGARPDVGALAWHRERVFLG